MPDATTASDWLPTFEFGLANDSSWLKRPARVSGAEDPFTLKLDARQSSSRWQPPALNVGRPTAAFEASELSLSTRCRPRAEPEADIETDGSCRFGSRQEGAAALIRRVRTSRWCKPTRSTDSISSSPGSGSTSRAAKCVTAPFCPGCPCRCARCQRVDATSAQVLPQARGSTGCHHKPMVDPRARILKNPQHSD